VLEEIIEALQANGITRTLCIQGGEPLCMENEFLTHMIISHVKERLPQVKIYVWTGYIYENLLIAPSVHIKYILDTIDYLIDGPYIEAERDITLPLRGSRNQRIINIDKT
jgi:anaerobic ribonucleoside-triphosphate reductase activating protein